MNKYLKTVCLLLYLGILIPTASATSAGCSPNGQHITAEVGGWFGMSTSAVDGSVTFTMKENIFFGPEHIFDRLHPGPGLGQRHDFEIGTDKMPIGTDTVTLVATDDATGNEIGGCSFTLTLIGHYTITVTNSGLPPSLPINVYVDGVNQGSILGGGTTTFTFDAGTTHQISMDSPISGGAGVQYIATNSPQSVSGEAVLTFNYKTQYYLAVNTDPAGLIPIAGEDWYDSGTMANTGTAPAMAGSYVFSAWKVDGSQVPGNPISVTMSAPRTAISMYNLDSTPPATITTLSGIQGNNGWYVSDVMLTFSAIDNPGGSNVKKTEYSFDNLTWITYTAAFTISDEGTKTVYYSSIDNAGNIEATKTETISIDKTPPSITGSRTPAANANGWNNADVAVHFDCSDSLSGKADCTPDTVISTEGAGQSVTGTATDKAGNSATAAVSGINIDKTPPTITGSRTPAANANGWNNADVTVHFDCSDSLSGRSDCTPDTVISTEGAGQSATGTATDKADNSKSATVSGINIDKTLPTITILDVIDGNGKSLLSDPQTTSSTVWIFFEVSDNILVSSFECALDGLPVTCKNGTSGTSVTAPDYSIHIFEIMAKDTADNYNTGSFSWKRVTALEATGDLITTIDSMPITESTKTSLDAPLKEAVPLLADNNPGNDIAVCGKTTAVIGKTNASEKNRRLNADQASLIRRSANGIKNGLGCR